MLLGGSREPFRNVEQGSDKVKFVLKKDHPGVLVEDGWSEEDEGLVTKEETIPWKRGVDVQPGQGQRTEHIGELLEEGGRMGHG